MELQQAFGITEAFSCGAEFNRQRKTFYEEQYGGNFVCIVDKSDEPYALQASDFLAMNASFNEDGPYVVVMSERPINGAEFWRHFTRFKSAS